MAGLGVAVLCDEDEHPAGDARGMEGRREGDFESHRMGRLGESGQGGAEAQGGWENRAAREEATERGRGWEWHATRVSAWVGQLQIGMTCAVYIMATPERIWS